MNVQSLPNYVKNVIYNETPFKVISFGEYEIRLYWSKKGVYGYQVIMVLWGSWDEKTESFLKGYFKTNGCGYSKEDSAIEKAFRAIGKKPKGMALGSESINYKYHVGGNFYKVPVKDARKVK